MIYPFRIRLLPIYSILTKRSEQYKASRVEMPTEYLRISRLFYPDDNAVMRRLSEVKKELALGVSYVSLHVNTRGLILFTLKISLHLKPLFRGLPALSRCNSQS